MTSLTFSEGLTSIGYAAFSTCSGLKSVTISSSVKQIDKGAFNACSSLTDVFCLAENVPSTASIAFQNSPITVATLHVPEGSVGKYKKSSPWSSFGNIVAIGDDSVIGDDGTGIDGIQNSEFINQNEEGSIIYDLSGRRVNNSKFKVQSSKPQRGIYIEKGRKVVK